VEIDYSGRVAVITGGARGFGKAFGSALARRGATVALIDRDRAAVEQAAAEIGESAIAYEGDVTDEERMNAIMGTVGREHAKIDILINNAGLHSAEYSKPLEVLGLAKIRRLFEVNMMGVIVCTFAAKPYMAGRAGANVLNISSSSAFQPGGYGVSKLGAIGLTITFARELSADGIRVNAIAPGVILTGTVVDELPPETLSRIKAMQYVSRHGEEDDVVNAMLYLTSPMASFVTAETLRLSGGYMPGI
jgi:3-oxoacyl-[acyl-carrier protein] reductase